MNIKHISIDAHAIIDIDMIKTFQNILINGLWKMMGKLYMF